MGTKKSNATPQAKNPGGRQSTYTQEKADTIVEQVSNGEPLAKVCRDIGVGLSTWYDWCEARPELAGRIARAREAGEEIIITDALLIQDEIPERTATEHGDKVDAGFVAWQKNRVETRLKLLAKWNPKKWGDKVAIGGASDLPPIQSTATIEPSEAYKKLLEGAGGEV